MGTPLRRPGRRCGDIAIAAAAAARRVAGVRDFVALSEAINAALHQAGFLV